MKMDLSEYRNKLIGSKDERAVSPVIGVILMVAITVILAAVIAAFVLDLGQSQGANPSAGITFDQNQDAANSSKYNVSAQINNIDRADSLEINTDGCTDVGGSFDSVGDTYKFSNCDPGDTVTVTGEYDGSSSVIQTYEVDG